MGTAMVNTDERTLPCVFEVYAPHLDDFGCDDAFEHELGDAVAALDLKILLGMVKEDNTHIATVVLVDDTGSSVDKVLPGEPRARCCGVRATTVIDMPCT